MSDFGLIWRPVCEYLQIKIFFFKNPALPLFYLYSLLTSCKKSEKPLEPFLRKLRYLPTIQPTNQTTNYYQQHQSTPRWRWKKPPSFEFQNSKKSFFWWSLCRIKLDWKIAWNSDLFWPYFWQISFFYM